MRSKVLFLIALSLSLCSPAFAQNKGGLDAVYISKNYYNSIVKILLYDSAAAKINADWGYLGRGSGFFVTRDGYIFTNRHVVDYCRGYCRYTTYDNDEKKEVPNIDVYSPALLNDKSLVNLNYTGRASVIVQVYNNANGSKYTLYHAKIIAIDTANFDGAILKLVSDMKGNPVTESFHPIPLGNSDSTEQGQDLCLYGFPAQLNGSFSLMLNDLSTLMFGKHAGFDYNINKQYGFIKTDATINNGNSGGPVFGPNNTVIGLATAAFTQTNLGLVGGINDMYELVHLLPDLEAELLKNGFIKPQKRPDVSTAMLFRPNIIPTVEGLKKINNIKSGNKISKCLGFYFGVYGDMPHNEDRSIQAYTSSNQSNQTTSTTNGGSNYKVPASGYGVSFGFTSKNVFKNQETNLLTGILKLGVEQKVFSGAVPNTLYSTPYPTVLQMKSGVKEVGFSLAFGLNYSRVLENGLILGLYYGVGYNMVDLSDINIGTALSYGQSADIQVRSDNIIFLQNFGVNLRYKCWFADIGYSLYTEKLVYTLPYVYSGSLFYTDYLVTGNAKASYVSLGIGYVYYIYSKKK